MLIVAIAWMYVVILMAFTQHSMLAGLLTVLGYGLLPLSVVLYLMATPARRRAARRRQAIIDSEAASAAASATASATPGAVDHAAPPISKAAPPSSQHDSKPAGSD